jgi:uncharacterized protein
MSRAPVVRRADRVMSADRIEALLAAGYSGHLGTVGSDGAPYVCPLLYVWIDGRIWLHTTSAPGHLQTNVRHEPRVCFEIDVPGQVFAYGRFQCDTAIEYRSVVIFGRARIVEEREQKVRFFDALMAKYFAADTTRPRSFYPRLDQVVVYELSIDRITGKETVLPAPESQWPATDRTKSPEAVPPERSR